MDLDQLEAQEKKILAEAKSAGVSDSYMFATTFERYKTQIRLCANLTETLKDEDLLVTKTYVKGRENIMANPLIQSINQTFSAANKTAETLMKIVKAADTAESKKPKKDKLLEALRS